jgi:hypothetical protein
MAHPICFLTPLRAPSPLNLQSRGPRPTSNPDWVRPLQGAGPGIATKGFSSGLNLGHLPADLILTPFEMGGFAPGRAGAAAETQLT